MSLKVLHVTPYAAEAWAYGGILRIASTLTRALAWRGHEVTVCTTDVCSRATRLAAPDHRHPHLRPWLAHESTTRLTTYVFPNVSNRLAYDWQLFTPIGLSHFLGEHAGSSISPICTRAGTYPASSPRVILSVKACLSCSRQTVPLRASSAARRPNGSLTRSPGAGADATI